MTIDGLDRDLARSLVAYLRAAEQLVAAETSDRPTPLGRTLHDYLGSDPAQIPVRTEDIPAHRLVDADLALRELADRTGGEVIGVSGGDQKLHSAVTELVSNAHTRFRAGPVAYTSRDTGPGQTRRVVAFGVWLLTWVGTPVAVVQRAPAPQVGREDAQLEILCLDSDVADALAGQIRKLMVELSVLHGKVLSLAPTQFGSQAGATFLARPEVRAEDVVLPHGVLDDIVGHVIDIGVHRDMLRRAGQHLKRGVLLHGPPGTGKTLTVRHLLSRTPEVTAVVLNGSSIHLIGVATEIARTFQPSIVVLEDIDLVAMERTHTPQPLLFEVLDALDGLDGDADVTFLMTTNRVAVLEQALADRPGRVDLAVEIPRPDLDARRRLLQHYARDLGFSDTALDDAANRTQDTTGAFAKELIRRAVLAAATRTAPVTDEDLRQALDHLLSEREAITRQLLIGTDDHTTEDHGRTSTEWTTYG